jgi:exopolysaccharide production protein ExoQ
MSAMRRFFEVMVMGLCGFILTKALLSLVLDPEETPTEGTPLWRLILTVSYLLIVIVLVPFYQETLYIVRRNWPVVALVLLAFVSSLWAGMPDLVLRKSIGLFGTTLFGIALAVRFSFRDQLRLLSWLFRIIAVLSLACIVLLPNIGISKDGEWGGIFSYKNALGSIMALCILVEWQREAEGAAAKILKALTILLAGVLLFFSDSITPAIALVATILLVTVYKFAAVRLRMPLYAIVVVTLVTCLVGSGLALAYSDTVTAIVGRSSNLTGRTEIWNLVVSFIPQRAIVGYGYSGFWLGAAPESYVINRAMKTWVMYSHNGYLEMLLSLGVIGLSITLGILAIGVKRAVYFSRQRLVGNQIWPLAFMCYFILHNLGECTILIQDIEWALFVACIAGSDAKLLPIHLEEEDDEFLFVPVEEPA